MRSTPSHRAVAVLGLVTALNPPAIARAEGVPCSPAVETDAAGLKAEIEARKVPDRDYYRDDAMAQVRREIEEARGVAQQWQKIERNYLEECRRVQAQSSSLARLSGALAALDAPLECDAWRQSLLELQSLGDDLRADALLPAELWLLYREMDPVRSPGFCTARPARARTDKARKPSSVRASVQSLLPSIGRRVDATLTALNDEHGELRREYMAQAARKFALEPLFKHQRELREAAAKDTSAAMSSETVGKLPWIIVILGVFCLSIMVMIRRFPKRIQREWVQSGQVVQFMTVTIMIIVILALGLSKNLNEESLGTLLGTIGGYVLSNGVGKRRVPPKPAPKEAAPSVPVPTEAPAPSQPPDTQAPTPAPKVMSQ